MKYIDSSFLAFVGWIDGYEAVASVFECQVCACEINVGCLESQTPLEQLQVMGTHR